MGFANFFTGKWNWTASAMGFAPQQFCWWKWKLQISRLDDWDADLAGKLGLHLALALLGHLNTELSFIPVVLSHIQCMNL